VRGESRTKNKRKVSPKKKIATNSRKGTKRPREPTREVRGPVVSLLVSSKGVAVARESKETKRSSTKKRSPGGEYEKKRGDEVQWYQGDTISTGPGTEYAGAGL